MELIQLFCDRDRTSSAAGIYLRILKTVNVRFMGNNQSESENMTAFKSQRGRIIHPNSALNPVAARRTSPLIINVYTLVECVPHSTEAHVWKPTRWGYIRL